MIVTEDVRTDLAILIRDLIARTSWADFNVGGVAHDDEDGDETTALRLTVGTDDGSSWGYQTGDNSFTGGAYGSAHWAVVYINPASDPDEIVREIVDQWEDLGGEP